MHESEDPAENVCEEREACFSGRGWSSSLCSVAELHGCVETEVYRSVQQKEMCDLLLWLIYVHRE